MSAGADDYIRLAVMTISYLRSRYHVEVPHISTVTYDYRLLRMLGAFRRVPTLVEVSGEEEEESTEEDLDPTKIRGHSTHGTVALFKISRDEAEIKMNTSFYIRTAPPAEFRKVVLTSSVERRTSRKIICIELWVLDENNSTIYHGRSCKECLQQSCNTIACVGLEEVACKAAEKVADTLYAQHRDSASIKFTDDKVVQALSTSATTKLNQIFGLTAIPPVKDKKAAFTSDQFMAVQNLLYEVSYKENDHGIAEASFILRYVGPVLAERSRTSALLEESGSRKKQLNEFIVPLYVFIDDRRNRWSIHHLMEIESELTWREAEPLWTWEREAKGVLYTGLHGLEPIGGLAVQERDKVVIRDWHITVEILYPLKKSTRVLGESFEHAYSEVAQHLKTCRVKFNEGVLNKALNVVCDAVSKAFPHITHLYEYQERALIEGLKALIEGKHKVFVLQTRTAGGKTLSFLMPLLVYLIYTKLLSTASSKREVPGVKALLFYPTTALQNDQASIIFSLLWHVNLQLIQDKIAITMGLLHRYVPRRDMEIEEDREIGKELRLRCPLCGSRLVIEWSCDTSGKFYQEVLRCSNSECKINTDRRLQFLLNKMVKASRDAVYSDPPDILIATPDIINARLTLAGEKEDPAALTILGKPAYVCRICGAVKDTTAPPRKCERCGVPDFQLLDPDYPKVVVIDEAHLFRGAFGAQASHVMTRIEQAVRIIKSLPGEWRPVYFISSATLNNPEERAVELVATDRSGVVKLSSSFEESAGAEYTHRVHVFVMPKVFSPQATTARIVEAVYSKPTALYMEGNSNLLVEELESLKQQIFGTAPRATIVFANRIAEVNELLNLIKWFVHGVQADGHTTDYGSERATVEDRFSRGELDIIVATRGLEVGVDFDRVNIGVIYGMPYYLTDYVQRVGRIGRRQNSIIFNVFMPDKPIDFFYFKNWKLLCDSRLRELHIRSEAYRISRDNIEALRRSALRCILDLISIVRGAGRKLEHATYNDIKQFIDEIKNGICGYIKDALGLKMMQSTVLHADADKISSELCREADLMLKNVEQNLSVYKTLKKALEAGLSINSPSIRMIRNLDQEVEYEYPTIHGSRTRELAYAVRHALPGQVISYKGLFFVINGIPQSYPLREE